MEVLFGEGGDLIPVLAEELTSRTAWAKEVVLEKWETLVPFAHEIHPGATARLPKTSEKTTALACRAAIPDLDSIDLEALVFTARERLNLN